VAVDTDIVRPRLRADAERNRERILEAAGRLFAEHGLEVALEDIAAEAGVGVGTLYRRFGDREELIDALFEQRMDAVIEVAKLALAEPSAWDGLVGWIEHVSDLMANDRGLRSLMSSSRHGRRRVQVARERIGPLVAEILERALREGSIRSDLELHDLPLIEFMLGAVADYTREIDPAVWRRCLTIVLDGIRREPGAVTPMPGSSLDSNRFDRLLRS
jgi:AcrR family transcriptional regulator